MKAIRIHKHGAADVLQIDEIHKPKPKKGEVLVRIKAASLNHMDLWVRKGIPGIGELPLILGCDGAGLVAEVGSGVKDFKCGDEVILYPLMNFTRAKTYAEENAKLSYNLTLLGEQVDGTHCEFIVMPATHVLKKPKGLDFFQAASFPLTFVTAWHMLVRKGRIEKGQDVLIMAATSGIGVAAVQIAKHFGARVIATGSGEERLKKLKDLGADDVLDHYKDPIAKTVKEMTQKKGVELIFEHVGEKVWAECLKALAWGGRLVTCGATSGPQIQMDLRHLFIKQQEILGSTMGSLDELIEICKAIEAKKIKPIVDKVFPYTEVQKAHEYLENEKPFGKVVLDWS